MAMKNAIISFWGFINDNWDEDIIDWFIENYDIDKSKMNEAGLAALSEEETTALFYSLVNLYMDVSKDESYDSVFELLKEITTLEEETLVELLELDD